MKEHDRGYGMRSALLGAVCLAATLLVGAKARNDPPPWQLFVVAAGNDAGAARIALASIRARWQNGFAPMFVDLARLLPTERRAADLGAPTQPPTGDDEQGAGAGFGRGGFPDAPPATRGSEGRRRILAFLREQTGQTHGDDLRAWRRWIWSSKEPMHPDYAVFKGELYGRIDPAFRQFFPADVAAAIRLDEIDWGGVGVNGIPPLRAPRVIPAVEARWLKAEHIVFGVELDGEARAYPKRILAWHELATDRLAGRDLTIVYCTLCGTVIPYESRIAGRLFTFGTSGLLYRSNKLMFDEETHSLWSAIDGTPAVGALVGSGLRLSSVPVVTTTWKDWKSTHPATTVLSLDTGFERDYSEGAAYRSYFSSDRLMFEVPTLDKRLPNKAEVLVVRQEFLGSDEPPVAIAVERLRREPVFAFIASGRKLVVVSSAAGANRVYEVGNVALSFDPKAGVVDANRQTWTAKPDALVSAGGATLPRVPAHRAFWFGWYAQHPETVLYR